jgi:2',3'-cyclic-nucleotide 2'-phosphodiesterase
MSALVLGDIIGHPGCRALFVGLTGLIKKYRADIVVANGENAAGGFGLTPDIAEQLFGVGVDVITSGNHIWQKKEIFAYLGSNDRVLRPANYPGGAPGKGYCTVTKRDFRFTVVNLQGRVRMYDVDSPFETGLKLSRSLESQSDAIIVDFHAEQQMEKEALALYLDGKVHALVGTHTHVQTADERILPGGTAFISDLGMTGPAGSVIGVDPAISIQRSLSQMPLKMDVLDAPGVIRGVHIEFAKDGNAERIERIEERPGL